MFIENFSDNVMEGDQVDFICRDSERDFQKPSPERVTIDWTFTNQTGSVPITRNGSLMKNMERFVLVPYMSLTLLKVRVSDSGLYRCEIKKSGQKASLTAEARLIVYHLSKYLNLLQFFFFERSSGTFTSLLYRHTYTGYYTLKYS
mgnify:CR=1 FL=1